MDITLLNVEVNLLILLASAILMFMIGAVWYMPATPTGKLWLSIIKPDMDSKEGKRYMMIGIVFSFIMSFVVFVVFAVVWPSIGIIGELGEYEAALSASLFLWFPAFLAIGMNNAYAQRRLMLTAIDTSYLLVGLVAGGLLFPLLG